MVFMERSCNRLKRKGGQITLLYFAVVPISIAPSPIVVLVIVYVIVVLTAVISLKTIFTGSAEPVFSFT